MKKAVSVVCLSVMLSSIGLPQAFSAEIKPLSKLTTEKAEAASVAGKSYSYYLSKKQTKKVYRSMKDAQNVSLYASIFAGVIPGGIATSVGIALSGNSVGQKEIEKAYHKNMRLKVTYKYGVTMSLNTTTFKAVK
ncbi:hypothetical protein ACWS7L_04155 [Exiguobacterium artemiae]